MQSRFNKFLHFDDYAPAELTEIFVRFARQGDYKIATEAVSKPDILFARLHKTRNETFGNARLARNLFEKAINNHASRLVSSAILNKERLMTLRPEDIPTGT